MSTETTARIRWEPGEDGILFGYSGTLKPWVFAICPPGAPAEFWMISTSFPLGQPRYVGSEGEARKAAERWLEEFVTSLGVQFPPEPLDDDQHWQRGEARDMGYLVVDDAAAANPAPAGEE